MTTVMTYNERTPHQQLITDTDGNVVEENEMPHPANRYKNIFMGIGITEVVIGVVSIILGGVSMIPSIGLSYYYIGYGLWGGAWYLAAGGLAIATGVRPNNCNVIGGMVVSILATLTAFGSMWYEAALAMLDEAILCGYYSSLCRGTAFSGIHGTIAVLAFVEFVVSIVHSSYCCCGCTGCCGNGGVQGTVVSTTVMTVPHVAPQFSMQPQHGYAYPQGQPQGYAVPQQFPANQGAPSPYGQYPTQQQQASPPPAYMQQPQKQTV